MGQESKRIYMVDDPEMRETMIHRTFSLIPHAQALELEFVELQRNNALGKMPYHEKFVGNLENGAVHTGVLISLIDSVAGLAVLSALPEYEVFVTLDLRVDCFKPSSPHQDLYAFAECYLLYEARCITTHRIIRLRDVWLLFSVLENRAILIKK